jgi:hypothetical protein
MTTNYEHPRIQSRERLHGHLAALTSGEVGVSAAFRRKAYEAPRIESREPFGGDMQTIESAQAPPP